MHTHMHADSVLESEKVSVLFSGQLGLIFSTSCFHTLTDSPQAETERERETHTNREETETSHSEHCIQRFHVMMAIDTHSCAQTEREHNNYLVSCRKTGGN